MPFPFIKKVWRIILGVLINQLRRQTERELNLYFTGRHCTFRLFVDARVFKTSRSIDQQWGLVCLWMLTVVPSLRDLPTQKKELCEKEKKRKRYTSRLSSFFYCKVWVYRVRVNNSQYDEFYFCSQPVNSNFTIWHNA